MLIVAVTHLAEGPSLETLPMLKCKSLCLLSGYMETNSIHNRTTVNFVLENINKK
jgi:hypothetical protein